MQRSRVLNLDPIGYAVSAAVGVGVTLMLGRGPRRPLLRRRSGGDQTLEASRIEKMEGRYAALSLSLEERLAAVEGHTEFRLQQQVNLIASGEELAQKITALEGRFETLSKRASGVKIAEEAREAVNELAAAFPQVAESAAVAMAKADALKDELMAMQQYIVQQAQNRAPVAAVTRSPIGPMDAQVVVKPAQALGSPMSIEELAAARAEFLRRTGRSEEAIPRPEGAL